MREKAKLIKKIDLTMILIMTILICIGLFCTRQAFKSSDELNSVFIKQLLGVLIGYVLIFAIIFIDYHIICSLSIVLYVFMIIILAFTLIFGQDLNNVKRWIVLFGIQFQPSELTKVVLILFLSFLCNHFKNKLDKLYVFFILTAVTALPIILILLEPHLSSCLAILFIFLIMIYSSGISYKVIGLAVTFILPVFVGIFIGVTLFNVKIPFIESYQLNRVLSFLSTDDNDNLDGDYQQLQSLKAMGSGELHGKMLLSDAPDREYNTIYAKESDFVFAIIGEEFGFIGSFLIILLYAILIVKCILISFRAPDHMGKLICIGVSSYLMFQIFVNISVATKILPNTGLPLPFISYGVTSLISSMSAIGLVINIGIRQKDKKPKNWLAM